LGVVFDFVDEEVVAEQASEWATFLARKLSNKDDVLLLREPAEVLSPLFLQGLQGLSDSEATLIQFDTYERSAVWLDSWLRELLDGRFGDVPSNLLLCIAGQYELDAALWSAYIGVTAKLPLAEFTDSEAREYLARKQITDEKRIVAILEASRRLPVLVATLADAVQRGDDMRDQSLTATERFLKWVEDPTRHQLAIDAALPRRLDTDVLTVVAPTQSADDSLQWLRRLPFVQDASKYHDLVRLQMLRHKRRLYPSSWSSLQLTLAEHYRSRCDQHIAAGGSERDAAWTVDSANEAYHELCALGESGQRRALQLFCAGLEKGEEYGKMLATSVAAAATDCESQELNSSYQIIKDVLTAIAAKCYSVATAAYTHRF
jgi:hypothetical protein